MPAGVLAEAVYEQGSAWPPTISADPERARLIRHVRRVACFKELERQIAFEGIGGALSNTNPHDLRDALDCCAAIDRPDLVELLERAKDCDEEDAGETMHAEWEAAVEANDYEPALNQYLLQNFRDIFETPE